MAIDPRVLRPQIGTSLPAPRLDPTGIVPVNRAQPVATDGAEAQRLMERRLGSMPPSSFSGSGAGFVPVDRPGIGQLPDRMTAMANMEQFGKPQTLPPLSNTARQALNLAEGLGAPGARATAARDVMELGNATIDRVKADQQARQAIKEQRKAQHAQKWQGRQAARGIDRAALQQRIAELMANRNTSAGPMGVPGGAGGLLGLRR